MDGDNLSLDPIDGGAYDYDDDSVRFPFMASYFPPGATPPPHVVTLRSNPDGWTNDNIGVSSEGAWDFVFSFAECTDFGSEAIPPIKRMQFKFRSDGAWATTPDITVIPWPGARFVYTLPAVAF